MLPHPVGSTATARVEVMPVWVTDSQRLVIGWPHAGDLTCSSSHWRDCLSVALTTTRNVVVILLSTAPLRDSERKIVFPVIKLIRKNEEPFLRNDFNRTNGPCLSPTKDKVEAHGIRGNYSRWIRNWLTGRTQRVVIHDEASDPALVTSGVPQGSVLGPLLFIIYNIDDSISISTILMSESSVKSTNSPMTRNSVTEHSPKGTEQLSNQTSTVFYNGLKPGK
ncbi:Reverse transcriptase domain [Trinorchestia longiramus]|nr:Reverse transcriptase domain [Trinorchestia longiramus]